MSDPPLTRPAVTSGWSRALGCAGLLAVTLVAYAPVFEAGFIWDDDAYVTENPLLPSPGALARIWFEPRSQPQYYPAVHTTFWLEYRVWGLDPTGYHAVNVLLHALAAWLLWRVLHRLGVPGAGFAAVLFALHPVHVESVAWITERKNVLSAVFYLAAARAYLEFEAPESPGARRPLGAWALAAGLFGFALLSKTVTASLPAALAVAFWWRRGRLDWRTVAPLLPLLAAGAGLGLITAWLETTHVGASGGEWSISLLERALVACRALWFYLAKLVWPHPLVFIYPRWDIAAGDARQWIYVAAAAALAAWLVIDRRRLGRGPLAAALFFAGTLFPALGFLNVYPHRFSWVADHFQYIASMGPLALFAGAASIRAPARIGRRPALLLALALLCTLGALTWRQTRVYRNAETLWRATLQHNPHSFLAHTNLGNLLLRRGDLEEALPHYRAAVEIHPGDVASLNNLAWALATAAPSHLRDGQEAVTLAERAASDTQRGSAPVLDTLAAAYAAVGRFDDAVHTAQRAVQIAQAEGDTELERELRKHLRLYQAGVPWRDPLSRKDPRRSKIPRP